MALPLLVALLVACGREAPPPDIVLVSIDTLRADHTSVYGYARDTTPELAALARTGVVFEVAYAPTSTTGPTHASLFTSLYPIAHGVVKNGLLLERGFDTLAEILSQSGYQTAAFVSSAVIAGRAGYGQGFDVYDDEFRPETSKTAHGGVRWSEGGILDRRAAATTDRALDWLQGARDLTRPFLLFVHFFDPHQPYAPPEPFDTRFVSDAPEESPEAAVGRYDGEVAYVDRELGRLQRGVDAVAPGALWVVTSDHGEGLSSHGVMGHGVFLYEAFVRVPLLVRWRDRIEPGRRLPGPVELVDLTPTLLELAGVDAEGRELQGHSLAGALLRGESLPEARSVYLLRRHFERGTREGQPVHGLQYGIRRGRFKYIEAPEERTRELYDVAADPDESFDLLAFAPQLAEELATELRRWREANTREVPARSVSEANHQQLEALGYVP